MAVTAAVTLSPSAAAPNTQVGVVLTITNNNSSAVSVTSVTPYVGINGGAGVNIAAADVGPVLRMGINNGVNASGGTCSFGWPVFLFAPQTDAALVGSGSSLTYAVGADWTTSDGTSGRTTTTIVITPTI